MIFNLEDLLHKFIELYTPGTKLYHERWCNKSASPCRCVFDNDKDYEKYGDCFFKIE